MLTSLLARLGATAERGAAGAAPWGNVVGLARTLLALCTLGTLALSSSSSLFGPVIGFPPTPNCTGMLGGSLFCLFPNDQLELARWLAVLLLAVTAAGWRPRLTAVPHWWVAWSFATSSTIPDGGDQIAQILTLVLIPVGLTDPRRWHWQAAPAVPRTTARLAVALLPLSALLVIRLQVAGIYFQSSVAKLSHPTWADGTSLYYWLTNPSFGAPGWLRELVWPVITWGPGVVALTWGALLVEFGLVLGLVAPLRSRGWLLLAGVALHASTAVLMGLLSFAFTMSAALVLYLRPTDRPFALPVPVLDLLERVPRGLAAPLRRLPALPRPWGVTDPRP